MSLQLLCYGSGPMCERTEQLAGKTVQEYGFSKIKAGELRVCSEGETK